jgi:hypothetical protein
MLVLFVLLLLLGRSLRMSHRVTPPLGLTQARPELVELSPRAASC